MFLLRLSCLEVKRSTSLLTDIRNRFDSRNRYYISIILTHYWARLEWKSLHNNEKFVEFSQVKNFDPHMNLKI